MYFPAFFDLRGQRVLVVGGGEVALRKVALLERTAALITVVAPELVPQLRERAAEGRLQVVAREFEPADLDGVRLVIVATARRAVNRWIANLSEAAAIPVNVVDDLEASRFIVPAIVDRDPVLIAVSTGGASPVLARRLRERLEAFIPRRIGEFAIWLRGLRKGSKERCESPRSGGNSSRPWSTVRRRADSSTATAGVPMGSLGNCWHAHPARAEADR